MLLGFYDRLRSRHLIQRATFNLPLTQEEIADYLGLTTEHVNRVLRHMREQNLLIMDRGVVVLRDVTGIRKIVGHNFGRKPDEPRLEVSDLEVSDRI